MISSIDQLGQAHRFERIPQRIVSLVPSITELLCDLGLSDQIVVFCIHPADIRSSAIVVGGTKSLHIDRVIRLQPDLIIANKEENTLDIVNQLKSICPVWVSDIPTVVSSYEMILSLSILTNTSHKGEEIIESLISQLSSTQILDRKKVIYLIWKNPYMTIGHDTYISDMLRLSGYDNAIKLSRYPTITIDKIKSMTPDHIFLSSEPYPFQQKDVDELKAATGVDSVSLVDGEFFSWYGTRILKKPSYLHQLREQLS